MTDEATNAAANTDRELWREREGDFYADSIHVTASGAIGIDCGGYVIVLPVREWHRRAFVGELFREAPAAEAPQHQHKPGDILCRQCDYEQSNAAPSPAPAAEPTK